MAIELPRDYWIEIPGGRYTVGLLPKEAKLLAEQSAAWFRHHGPEWSSNDLKLLGRHIRLEEMQGNAAWAEKYLLAHFPAREVTLAPFAIAKNPVTNGLYRQFMAETGECIDPSGYMKKAPFAEDDRPTRGIAWLPAVAFAEWAGARLPFEDEWERAMRGPERWLFPWGNEHKPLGWDILEDTGPRLWTVDATRSPEGVCGGLIGMPEWCADHWIEAAGIRREDWGECTPRPGGRAARGGDIDDRVIIASVIREVFGESDYENSDPGMRLVRADGRSIPPSDPDEPLVCRQDKSVRTFEVHRLTPVLRSLRESPIDDEHGVSIEETVYSHAREPDIRSVKLTASRTGWVRQGPPDNAQNHVHGMCLTAVSKETMRRTPPQHGVFAWTVEYRYPRAGPVMARSVAAYHMSFDGEIHRMISGFRPGENETPIDAITPKMIETAIREAFWFYDRFADADQSPF